MKTFTVEYQGKVIGEVTARGLNAAFEKATEIYGSRIYVYRKQELN